MKLRLKLKRKTIAVMVAVIVLIVVIVIVVKGMSSPAVGSLDQTPSSQQQKAVPYSQPGHFTGKYISYSYPAHFRRENSAAAGNILESDVYGSADLGSQTIAISVYKGSLDDDSGVQYRQKHPELYTQTSSRLGLEFVKNDGSEDTFFMTNNGLVASVSATTRGAPLNHEALYVASGLKWR